MDAAALEAGLTAFLTSHVGPQARIEGLRPLAGGASRDMYEFELAEGERRSRYVLRMDPDEGRMQSDRSEEFHLLRLAAEAGVRVPRVYWLGSPEDGLGRAFLVMERLAGETLARRLLREPRYERTRERLPHELARELARIHAIEVEDPRLRALRDRAPAADDPRRFALAELDRYRTLLEVVDEGYPRPVLALAGRWLEQNAPAAARVCLVHGDFRVGNVMFDEKGLVAVLDWELAHIGDPLEDLGWLAVRAWRFGRDDRAIGGLADREAFWRDYAHESGHPVDANAARWWELFGNWKWAIICIVQAASHRAGRYPNVELASLGRRVAEVEWEILELLETCDAR